MRRYALDGLLLVLLLLLPLLLFAPVALGGQTVLPADILYSFEPFRSQGPALGVPSVPQNGLLADLVLENYVWKQLILDAFHSGQLPLWDPYLFSGHPFLANGQHSAFYPLSVIYYGLPLARAYGVFTVVQLGLAGIWMYLLARTLGATRLGAFLAGIGFQFSGFLIVSVVHPMIIAAASWLPLLLALTDLAVRRAPFWRWGRTSLPWALLGALALGFQILAGHGENTYFVLLVTGAFAGWRLLTLLLTTSRPAWRQAVLMPALSLILMLILGLGLGAVQLVPLYDVIQTSFRQGSVTLQDVLSWAYPKRRILTFLIPNFFGNPAHHTVRDVFTGELVRATVNAQGQPIQSFDWGIKNYVEGGAYLGLLPPLLALLAVVRPLLRGDEKGWRGGLRRWLLHPYIPFFTLLALFSLGCIFGTRLYALVFALPFLNQSHSPFRWVFPLTVSVMVLAALGVSEIREMRTFLEAQWAAGKKGPVLPGLLRVFLLDTRPGLPGVLAALAFWSGLLLLGGLWASRLAYPSIAPGVERLFLSLARAPEAFPDARTFYSYEFPWIQLAALLLIGTGAVLRVSHCPIYLPGWLRRRPVWEAMAIGLLLVDMLSFGAGFNPATDPALLTQTPPVVDFLRKDPGLWRFSAFDPHGAKTFNMNAGMYFGFQDIRGYDSLFSSQYVRYMSWIEPQGELLYNRIASFSQFSSLDSPLTDLLNVKYIVSEIEIPLPKYREVYRQGELRVYENLSVMPRAFTLPVTSTLVVSDVTAIHDVIQTHDPRFYAIVEAADVARMAPESGLCRTLPCPEPAAATVQPQPVVAYELNQVVVEARSDGPAWLVLGDAYAPGWKAFVRPVGSGEDQEAELPIARLMGNFRGVLLEPGAWTVRFRYSPDSVKVGGFTSFLTGMIWLFLVLVWGWTRGYRESREATTVQRVAKNSVAPILLNLFNRAIDFAFAALMLRVLGPSNAGDYYYAIVIFGWFEIFTNFGLNAYLTREVSRCRDRANCYLFNTTALRLVLVGLGLPFLAGFLALRQAWVAPALNMQTLTAIGLLYLGLIPGSVSTGLTALFYAYEKAEYPAALTTFSTLLKAALGTAALILGWGIVGLAGAAVVINWATLGILALVAGRSFFRLRWEPDSALRRAMLGESWPLMINHLLATLFFKVDIVLLEAVKGSAVVGWYSTAYKFLDALNVIPSMFTMAVFPVVSRQATEDPAALLRFYRLGVKLLVVLSLPAALVGALLAREMVLVLGDRAFLPHSMIALQLMIWSIPIGWINSLTNYVLIALNQQRYLTWAFVIGLAFNLGANVIFIPVYGYAASAVITIFSELALLIPFAIGLQRHLGKVGWGSLLVRPLAAGAAMGAVALLLLPLGRGAALLGAMIAYGLALWRLELLMPEERMMLAPLLRRG